MAIMFMLQQQQHHQSHQSLQPAPAPAVAPPAPRPRKSRRACGAVPAKALSERLLGHAGQPGAAAACEADVPHWACFLPAAIRPKQMNSYDAFGYCGYSGSAGSSCSGQRENMCPGASAPWEEPAAGASPKSTREAQVVGRVWPLSLEARGCRQVQAAFDSADSNEAREALAGELRGRVAAAAQSPHANHVLQKCVETMRPQAVQFIIDEMVAGRTGELARHKYGCRIFQRLLESCHHKQTDDFVRVLLRDGLSLCRHSYGNYIAQSVLAHGSPDCRRRLEEVICQNLRLLVSEPHGCAVVAAALAAPAPDSEPAVPGAAATEDGRATIARMLLKEKGLLAFMAAMRNGHTAAIRVMEVLQGKEREAAAALLSAASDALRHSRWGQEVLLHIDEAPGGAGDARAALETACRAGA